MSKEFEEFKRSIGENNSKESVVRKKHQCPHCSEPLSEAYIDQNPFPGGLAKGSDLLITFY